MRSEREDLVRGGSSAGSGLKASQTGLNATNKRVQGLLQKKHKVSMELHKSDALKLESAGFGLERKEGAPESGKVAARHQGLDRIDARSQETGAKSPSKDSETAKGMTRQPVLSEWIAH